MPGGTGSENKDDSRDKTLAGLEILTSVVTLMSLDIGGGVGVFVSLGLAVQTVVLVDLPVQRLLSSCIVAKRR